MRKFVMYIKKEIVPVTVLSIAGIIVMCMLEVMISGNTAVTHNIEIWIEACGFIDFFFPLFVSLPFAWKIYFECKDGYINYVSIRTKRRNYLAKRIAAGMLSVFVMVFVMYYAGLVYAEIFVVPKVHAKDIILDRYIWGKLQMEYPIMFGVFWCAWKGVVGALICLFGYGIALLSENIFVISLLPFVYCVLENFVTGTIGLENYSIYTSFVLDRLSPDAMRVHNYYVGVLIFIVMTGAIISVWICRKKRVD